MAKTKTKRSDREAELNFKDELGPKKRLVPPDSEDKKASKARKKAAKKARGGRLKIIIIIFVALLLLAASAFVFILSQREGGLLSIIPLYSEYRQMLDYEAEFDSRMSDLSAREAAVAAEELRLEALASRLEDETVKEEPGFSQLLDELSEEKINELQRLGAIYSKVEAQSAARILSELYETREIALVVYNMKPEAAALVLESMSAPLAAEVTAWLTS